MSVATPNRGLSVRVDWGARHGGEHEHDARRLAVDVYVRACVYVLRMCWIMAKSVE